MSEYTHEGCKERIHALEKELESVRIAHNVALSWEELWRDSQTKLKHLETDLLAHQNALKEAKVALAGHYTSSYHDLRSKALITIDSVLGESKSEHMRIQIKTNKPCRDKDIKALYILTEGVRQSRPEMLEANLRFVLGAVGYALFPTHATTKLQD